MVPNDDHSTEFPAAPSCEIRTVRVGEDLFLLVSGVLHLHSAAKIGGAIWVAENRVAREVTVDLSDLRSLDSAGLDVLLNAHTRSERNGRRLRFVPSKYAAVRQVVAVAGASRMFG